MNLEEGSNSSPLGENSRILYFGFSLAYSYPASWGGLEVPLNRAAEVRDFTQVIEWKTGADSGNITPARRQETLTSVSTHFGKVCFEVLNSMN